MKKITNYKKALNIYKQFLDDHNIINRAKELLSVPNYEDMIPNIYKEVKRNNFSIEDLFLAKPSKLEKMVSIIKNNQEEYEQLLEVLKPYINHTSTNGTKVPSELKPYYKIVKSFYNYYSIFADKQKKYAYKFASALEINFCPYCDLDSTDTVGEDVRPSFDHYYPKKKYPLLAISFYNIIPSCDRCNSRFKGEQEFKRQINPYVYDFHKDAKFIIDLKNDNDVHFSSLLNDINSFDFKLVAREKNNNLFEEQQSMFKLETRYNSQKLGIIEYIERYNTNTPELIKEVENCLSDINNVVIKRVFGSFLSEDSIHKIRLAKLKLDLADLFSDRLMGLMIDDE